MKIFCTLLCGLVINFTSAQFIESFDATSTFPIPWEGQTNSFQIQNGELRLNTSVAGNSQIYLPPSFFYYSELEMDLKIRLPFAPSGSNYLNLFIYTDSLNPQTAENAYYLRFGESGSNDAIALHGIFSGNDLELARGLNGRIASSTNVNLKITYQNSELNIELWNDSIQTFETEIFYTDTANFTLNTLGFYCNYTVSNSSNFYFDEVYIGPIVYDTIPPSVVEIQVLDSNSLEVHFSEELDTTTFDWGQITLDNPALQAPIQVNYANKVLTLDFFYSFQNNQWSSLYFDSLFDLVGNGQILDTNFLLLYTEPIAFHDLVLNEIMADPSPSFGLPQCEYVEIQNVSSKIINLKNVLISDLSTTVKIATDYYLLPNEFVLLTNFNCLDSFAINNCLYLNLPSLNNTEDWLAILNADSLLIDSLTYNYTWHESTKKDGGYALEKANSLVFCGKDNWFSSQDTLGGTPGFQNAVFESVFNISFQVLSVELVDSNSMKLTFNKPLNDYLSWATLTCNFSITAVSSSENQVYLDFGASIFPGDEVQLSIENLVDCFGNQFDTLLFLSAPFFPNSTNLILNEILFNPSPGGSDYVELFNTSENPIELRNCSLANYQDSISNHKVLSMSSFILKAHEYCVITKDSSWVKNVFKTNNNRNFIQISSLPSFPDAKGDVYLLNAKFEKIDYFSYNENMHYSLLKDFENKSLERIAPNVATNEISNWNTASGNENYGTPGAKNSQFIDANPDLDFEIIPNYFTPNNDGIDDNLMIHLKIETPGVYDLMVFNLDGQIVKYLIEGEYLNTNKSIFWNGKNQKENLCNSGIYIFRLLRISEEGRKESKRKSAYLKL